MYTDPLRSNDQKINLMIFECTYSIQNSFICMCTCVQVCRKVMWMCGFSVWRPGVNIRRLFQLYSMACFLIRSLTQLTAHWLIQLDFTVSYSRWTSCLHCYLCNRQTGCLQPHQGFEKIKKCTLPNESLFQHRYFK